MPTLFNKMPVAVSGQEAINKGLQQLQQSAIPATTGINKYTEASQSCIIDEKELNSKPKCNNCNFPKPPAATTTVAPQYDQCIAEPTDDLDHEQYSVLQRSLAGGLAGLVEHLAVYPLDTIKTNRVTGLGKQLPISSRLDYVKWYGTRRAWAGVHCLIPGCTVAHAFQFPCIEYSQKLLENRNKTVLPTSFWAGMIGILPHDLVMNPANVIKQQMQQVNNQKGSIQIARELYRSQGLGIFYRSFPVQYGVGATFMGTFYFCYSDLLVKCQNKLSESNRKFFSDHWYLSWFLRNTIATSAAVIITQPLDNVVTRVNTQHGAKPGQPVTRKMAFIQMTKERAFLTGICSRWASAIPASILTWGTYEALKYSLGSSRFG